LKITPKLCCFLDRTATVLIEAPVTIDVFSTSSTAVRVAIREGERNHRPLSTVSGSAFSARWLLYGGCSNATLGGDAVTKHEAPRGASTDAIFR
jgi:hypothetical protein